MVIGGNAVFIPEQELYEWVAREYRTVYDASDDPPDDYATGYQQGRMDLLRELAKKLGMAFAEVKR